MAHALKIKRSGIHRIFKKRPLRDWLDTRGRSELTYSKNLVNREGTGWRTEDFIRECWHRGIDVRIGTVNKWLEGSHPKPLAASALRKEFPTIPF